MNKTIAMYLTVRVDIEIPENMDEKEAKDTAFVNLDYQFKLPEWTQMTVTDSSICDVNDEY